MEDVAMKTHIPSQFTTRPVDPISQWDTEPYSWHRPDPSALQMLVYFGCLFLASFFTVFGLCLLGEMVLR